MSGELPLNVEWTNVFKRDYKRAMKRKLGISLLDDIIGKLSRRETLPPKNQDHPLHNNWAGFRECHIASDWLLIYRIFEEKLVLSLTRTGSHSDLF